MPPAQAKTLTEVDRDILVHIGVLPDTNFNFKLEVFPYRSYDSMVFHGHGGQASIHKPRNVTFLAHGLQPNQTIKITAKTPNSNMFDDDELEIVHPCNAVSTSVARRGPPSMNLDLQWGYDVDLVDSTTGTKLAMTLDPTVVIKDDP